MDFEKLISHVDRWLRSQPSQTSEWSSRTSRISSEQKAAQALRLVFDAGLCVRRENNQYQAVCRFAEQQVFFPTGVELWDAGSFPQLAAGESRLAAPGLKKTFLNATFPQMVPLDPEVVYFQVTPAVGWCFVADCALPWVDERMLRAQTILDQIYARK